MISQDDISAAPRQTSPFEVKPQETVTVHEIEKNEAANDFGRFMEKQLEPSVQNSKGNENHDVEPIIVETHVLVSPPQDNIITPTLDSIIAPLQDSIAQTDQPQTEIEAKAIFGSLDKEGNPAAIETASKNPHPSTVLEAEAIGEVKAEASKTHPISGNVSKVTPISSDDSTAKLNIKTAETLKPTTPDTTAEPSDIKLKPETLSVPKAASSVTPPSAAPVINIATQSLGLTQLAQTNTRKTETPLENDLPIEASRAEVNLDTDLILDKLTLSRADKDSQINASLTNQQMTERGLSSSAPMALANIALASDTAILTAASSGLTPSIVATSSSPMLTVAAPNLAVTATLNAPSLSAIAQSIAKTVDTQKGVSVRLDPPEMGRVYIDYIFEGERSVTALVRADLPEALTQLRDQSAQLQSLLKEQGFENVNLSFDQNSSEQKSFDEEAFKNADNYALNNTPNELADMAKVNEGPLRNKPNTLNTSLDIKL